MNWEKAARMEAGRTNPYKKVKKKKGPTSRQTKYIARLRREAGIPRGPMPKTVGGAIYEIDLLLGKKKKNKPRNPELHVPKKSRGLNPAQKKAQQGLDERLRAVMEKKAG